MLRSVLSKCTSSLQQQHIRPWSLLARFYASTSSSSSSTTKPTFPELDELLQRLSEAQEKFSQLDQTTVDHIFREAALEANMNRLPLAKLAVEDTDMGIVEDKVIKNHFASEFVYHKYKDMKTCGVVEEDKVNGIVRFAEPVGPVLGIIPVTNPTSTVIFKSLLCLKTRNAVLFSPHPKAARCTAATAKLIHNAAVKAGAPPDCVMSITPSSAISNYLLHHPVIKFIVATGGGNMVKACYESGKPAIGVGAGNTPAVIDELADVKMAVSSIMMSKTFDNGVICASEQAVLVVDKVYDEVRQEFLRRGAYILDPEETERLRRFILVDGAVNGKVVGQPARKIASLVGIDVPPQTVLLVAEISEIGDSEPLSHEKLSPVLAMYRVPNFDAAVDSASQIVHYGGMGHTSCLYTDTRRTDRIRNFERRMPTGRVLIDSPATFGAIGDLYNFRLEPSMSLGVGSWGGSSLSSNVGASNFLNIKSIAEKRENMQWLKLPKSIYFKRAIIGEALKDIAGKTKRALVITDDYMVKSGQVNAITSILTRMGIQSDIFHQIHSDPTIASIHMGVAACRAFQPDVIIALGGGSPIDASKVIRLLYEHPEMRVEEMYTRFMDIRKKIVNFPNLGTKVHTLIAIPTTSGTGAEVTPFAVVKDEKTNRKYPLADYSLVPDMAIVDPLMAATMPPSLTAWTGLDTLTHAIESYTSVLATDYTRAMSLQAIKLVFDWLPKAYADPTNLDAREHMHNAACIAGIAFGNAFLGVCHSMAHALGSELGIPHGLANAYCLPHVIRYNAVEAPFKRAVFSQYRYYHPMEDYANIARFLGLSSPSGSKNQELVDILVEKIEKLKVQVGVPLSLVEGGVTRGDFEAKVNSMSELAFDDQCSGSNPRYPLIAELKELYLSVFEKPTNPLSNPDEQQ